MRASGVPARIAAVALMLVTALGASQGGFAAPAQADTRDVIPSSNPIDITPRILDEQARSIVEVGDRMVVGGNFTQIQNSGSSSPVDQPYVFAFDLATGKVDTGFLPALNGEVTTVLPHPDGDKVWVAGAFSRVNEENHSRIVLLDVATGAVVISFNPPVVSAAITDMKLVGGRLYIGGDFAAIGGQPRAALATLDPDTGALTDVMNSAMNGTLQEGQGITSVKAFDVSPDGSRLVAIGNFAQVDGAERVQLAMWDTSGATATLRNWATQRFGNTCKETFPTYLRGIVDYSVDYGDGTVVSGVNSQHQYVADGTYTVTDNRGAASSESRTVSVARPVNIDPSAVFSVGCWGLECDVDASASTDSDGNIVAYDWDFGDSSTGSGPTASHVFAIGGTYSVSVTVTDDRGGVDTATQEVVVNAIPTSIAFRAADSADGGNGSLLSVAIPAATQEGDLMLLFISNATSRIADTPSGWTDLGAQADDDLRTQVFWRFASVEDLGTLVSARLRDVDGLAQSAPNTSMIAVYSGVDAPPVVDAASASEGTTVNGGVTNHTTPHVMVPANGQWLVSYWADRTASLTTSWTAPSGELLRAEEFSSGSSSRAASLMTDGGGPILAGMRGGLTATADGASRKATMWSIVLRTR